MRGSGGTEGGLGKFAVGFGLSALGLYLFFDSVRVTAAGHGWISGLWGPGWGGSWQTASKGIVFVPFLLGVVALFYNSRMRWAWWLTGLGIAVLAVEILSRIRFFLNMKLTYLLGMIALFGAGVGLMVRSFRDEGQQQATNQPAAKDGTQEREKSDKQ